MTEFRSVPGKGAIALSALFKTPKIAALLVSDQDALSLRAWLSRHGAVQSGYVDLDRIGPLVEAWRTHRRALFPEEQQQAQQRKARGYKRCNPSDPDADEVKRGREILRQRYSNTGRLW